MKMMRISLLALVCLVFEAILIVHAGNQTTETHFMTNQWQKSDVTCRTRSFQYFESNNACKNLGTVQGVEVLGCRKAEIVKSKVSTKIQRYIHRCNDYILPYKLCGERAKTIKHTCWNIMSVTNPHLDDDTQQAAPKTTYHYQQVKYTWYVCDTEEQEQYKECEVWPTEGGALKCPEKKRRCIKTKRGKKPSAYWS